jgi:SAM-dependent methyltransferase
MSESPKREYVSVSDWEEVYRRGTPPWDAGKPHAELVRVLSEYRLCPETVLEMGCGTGADAILLAQRRYEVTAVDCSAIALERARLRAEQYSAPIHFVLADIFDYVRNAPRFDFVYDAGLYHALRRETLEQFLDVLWRVTKPGSYYLCLAGAPDPDAVNGPPQVTEEEIRGELGRLFETIHLRPIRIESPIAPQGFAGWSCLMQRPQMSKV